MSAIAAIVGWEGAALERVTEVEVAGALNTWPNGAVRVASCPGSVLGASLLPADQWRARDRQPLIDRDSHLAVVADCRLDEREGLCHALALGADATDAELLIAGYRRWGKDLPRHLDGDFACVVWDWNERQVVAFRDPLGIKPLYAARVTGGVAIASDPELIIRLVRPNPEPDDQAVIEHLLWKYVSTDRSHWAAIEKIPGGHLRVETPAAKRTLRYWTPSNELIRARKPADIYERFRDLFFQSVKRRFDSTGPILAHLSGGVDSSLVVCVANQILRTDKTPRPRLAAVSQRYPGTSWDEGAFIASVGDWTGIERMEWDGSKADFIDLLAPSLVGPGMMASRSSGSRGDLEIAGAQAARVILSGEGGDQLGMPWGLIDDLVAEQPFRFAVETIARQHFSRSARMTRLRRLFYGLAPRAVRRALRTARGRRDVPLWLDSSWGELALEILAMPNEGDSPDRFEHHVQRAHWYELTSGRTQMALGRQQLVAARHGVELRFPFLDKDLVEYVLSLGPECWPRGPGGGRLHRIAMGNLLPPKIRERADKASFSGASAQLLRRSKAQIDALFQTVEWRSARYVSLAEARVLLERTWIGAYRAGADAAGDRSWLHVRAIATLEAWLREVFRYAFARGTSRR